MEYSYVGGVRSEDNMVYMNAFMEKLEEHSIDLAASKARIKSLFVLSPQEFKQLPFPR